ncbi:GTPase [Pantoea sp. 18069]|uniref:GTPase n=1 Tax=Pantoea sp. 18069 TaxID=2681415 RepID=UPI00135689DC|nr:GTPase [Pantoea sp. 18069]
MTPSFQRQDAELQILCALPGRAHDLARLGLLAAPGRAPVVTVIGKYNHGKSRLLNELIGMAAFSVADRRETLVLGERLHAGVCWLDAPGLDADVDAADDGHALQAAWLKSDIRLFVHAAKEGELDAAERSLLAALRSDAQRSKRQTLLVLTQVDQLVDEAQQQKVMQAIALQTAAMALHAVSSTRYRQGVDAGKRLLLERSGIPALQSALKRALEGVAEARWHEAMLLFNEIQAELLQLQAARQSALQGLCHEQVQQRLRFDTDLIAVLDKVAESMRAVLAAPGPDHSLTPDSFANQFKLTPGKLERNRLQVAYSTACIEINAVLLKHGATELPLAQQTSVRSLDSVMVAVMGVYVKYRRDLGEIFCQVPGRERLLHEFSRYYEASVDRVALARSVAAAGQALRAADQALAAHVRCTPSREAP